MRETRKKTLAAILILLFIVPVPFLPSVKNDFVNWDDGVYITENKWIKDLTLTKLLTIFTNTYKTGEYIPLAHLTYALEYSIFGLNRRVYHRTNLILHVSTVLIVFWFVLLLSQNVLVSFLCAVLFGVHPLRVESVAWASERKDVLFTPFFMLSLIFYLRYRGRKAVNAGETQDVNVSQSGQAPGRSGKTFYSLSIFMFILSLLSKQTAMVLPFFLILLDFFLYEKFTRRLVFEKVPFFTLSLLLGIFLIHPSTANVTRYEGEHFAERLMAVMSSPVFYLEKTIIPVWLSALYPYNENIQALHRDFILSAVISTYILFLSVYFLKYTRKFLFSVLFFGLGISPMLLGLPFSGSVFAADRYTYLASIGLFFAVGEAFLLVYKKMFHGKLFGRLSFSAICSLYILSLSFLTLERSRVWRDSIALWQDVLAKHPRLSIAHVNLSCAYMERGDLENALAYGWKAMKITPDAPKANGNMGTIFLKEGEPMKAIPYFLKAAQHKSEMAKSYHNLAICYAMLKDYKKSSEYYRKALLAEPELAEAWDGLGLIYLSEGRYEAAIEHFEKALKIDPFLTTARKHLEKAQSELGSQDKGGKENELSECNL